MKFQIKSLLVLTFALLSVVSLGQNLTVVAGGNYTNVAYDQGSSGSVLENTYDGKIGFHAGGYIEYVINKDRRQEWVFEAGLLFDSKGTQREFNILDYTSKEVTNLYYIDVPVYLTYRYRLRSRNKIYAGIGPYVGCGLFGNWSQTTNEAINEQKAKIKWGNDPENDDLKRLDYGATARVGFHFDGGLDFSASYDYGIPNIASMGENISMKSRVLRVSVGYSFSPFD